MADSQVKSFAQEVREALTNLQAQQEDMCVSLSEIASLLRELVEASKKDAVLSSPTSA